MNVSPVRAAILGSVALLLAACSSDGGSTTAGNLLIGMVEGALSSDDETQRPPDRVSRERAAGVAYASIGVRIDDNPQILFPLANTNGDNLLYTYGYAVSIVIRHGRVVRTQGLARDALGGRWEGEDIIRQAMVTPGIVKGVRWIETDDRGIQTHEALCEAQAGADQPVTILGTPIAARYVREECAVPDLKWRFVNHFWIGPTNGQIWKSIQQIHPKVNPLIIETFRPAQTEAVSVAPAPAASDAGG